MTAREHGSQHEVVAGLLRAGSLLASTDPLSERMSRLCCELVVMLDCDRSNIMLWNGSQYVSAYSWGNPPDLEALFRDLTATGDEPLVHQVCHTGSYGYVNDAAADPGTNILAYTARLRSIVCAAMSNPDGSPLGFITASFAERPGRFTDEDGEVVLGIARLAQSALITERWEGSQRRLHEVAVSASSNERDRIGREIHDDPLQRVFTLYMRLQSVCQASTDTATRDALAPLVEDCRDLAASLRNVTTVQAPIFEDDSEFAV